MLDTDKTIPPFRTPERSDTDDLTIPGKRDRKPDGRFSAGDMIMHRYQVLCELGQGGMGVVYKCFDETAGIEIALKALPPELSHNTLEMEDIKENFQLVSKLVHQNIAISKNLEKDAANGDYYLIMECCEGEDLRRWIRRKRQEGSLTLDDVLPIIRQTASALDYAHEMRVMHRDIKPGNIMIDQYGRIKVLDFGLAAQIHTSMTRVSMMYHETSGTGPYMAPEQWRGRAQGAASDQYALAVMTYEMLAGHLPFENPDTVILREAVLNDAPESIPGVPQTIQSALFRAMSKDPAERFESCSEFVEALSGKKTFRKKPAKLFFAASILLLILLGAGAASYFRYTQINQQKIIELDKARKHKIAEKRKAEELHKAEELRAMERLKAEETALENINLLHQKLMDKKSKINLSEVEKSKIFSEKLNILNTNESAGELAVKKRDFSLANSNFEAALNAADWIINNIPLKKETDKLCSAVEKQKLLTDDAGGRESASDLYREAGEYHKKADEYCRKGNFISAIEMFKSARTGYERAAAYSRQVSEKKYIAEAEAAGKNGNWQQVKELAEKIRQFDRKYADDLIMLADSRLTAEKRRTQLDMARKAMEQKDWYGACRYADLILQSHPGDTDAVRLKQEAVKELKPKIEITSIVNGRVVPAEITVDDKKYTLPCLIELAPGVRKLVFEYEDKDSLRYTVRVGDTHEKIAKKTGQHLQEILNTASRRSLKVGQKLVFSSAVKYRSEQSLNVNWQGTMPLTVNLQRCTPVPPSRKIPPVKQSFSTAAPVQKQQYNVTLPNGTELEMAHIPCGSFKRSDGAAVLLTEEYYIGKFEVTQSQWMAVMPNNPSFFQGETLPVERISWYDAKNFCVKLNEMCAKQLPAGFSFDLPTEAQWEFACRAGTITEFSFGNTPESEKMNVNGNSGQQTVPAGLSGYKNAFGLYDMHGNVSEWCRDWYDSYGNTTTDPAGPLYGSYRVCRGGSWFDRSEKARSSARTFDLPQNRNNSRGLRIALVKKSKNTNSGVSSSQQPKDTGTGIPVLKDIPIIGRIFSVDSK